MWKSKEESELRKKERVEKNKRMKRLTEKEIICTALTMKKVISLSICGISKSWNLFEMKY